MELNLNTADLDQYRARGFPGSIDAAIAAVGVAKIDRQQAQAMIRLCPQTESILYGREFSSHSIKYNQGSRPILEGIATSLRSESTMNSARRAMRTHRDRSSHRRRPNAMLIN